MRAQVIAAIIPMNRPDPRDIREQGVRISYTIKDEYKVGISV